MSDVADECIHGLTAAWCAVCKDKDKKHRVAWRRAHDAALKPGDKFVKANYDGFCAAALAEGSHGCAIEVGDWIVWDEELDGWVCQSHAEPAEL